MSKDTRPFPAHVGIIMDGNGRWAKAQGVPRIMGHNAGMQAMKKIVIASSDMGIKYLTVYAFSTENWKRSTEEVSGIFNLIVKYVNSELEELDENNVHINIFGEYDMLPKASVAAIDKMVGRLADNDGLVFNIALNYGGRDEILRSVKEIYAEALEKSLAELREAAGDHSDKEKLGVSMSDCSDKRELGVSMSDCEALLSRRIAELSEDDISAHLYSGLKHFNVPDPDLIIRTSGEERMSNFLTWQAAYSELMFTDTLWPDFSPDEYKEMIEAYANRDRRFGGRKKEFA
ncbi:MAG: di-trans,poly-cis-decaprenylcistransferase [Mogibacterium sp.]|nr:di-trans,poly-cis-decaprenylcistransferase [Mogibacterium sp.]